MTARSAHYFFEIRSYSSLFDLYSERDPQDFARVSRFSVSK